MKQRLYKLILCVICVASFSVPAYVRELDTKAVTMQTTEATSVSTRARQMEYKKKELGTETEVKDLGSTNT